eukprot:TRINITY_DN3598_c0_g1_i1.p1 TRINITY_DN3598_c0_g1~~TRINITY_DN3598_c0_g1_i1.p1  ORF type:complete len:366 (-),score=122.46 TRINITY_DN3598_c0_g1_i1:41-1138(-)
MVFDMLTGINTSIVESSAYRAKREEQMNLDYSVDQIVLIPKDFSDIHRFHHKEKGLTDEDAKLIAPGQTYAYSFKFSDYSPFVFDNIRTNFGFETGDYLRSLGGTETALCELVSPGKSGSFFYYSVDYRFIIKTVVEAEMEFFREFLKYYYQYMIQNPNTLLVRFYGMHMVQPRGTGRELYFVVMGNTLQSEFGIIEKYDLKGSTVGRFASEKEKANENVILKDLDIAMKRKIRLGKEAKKRLMDQLEKDTKLLAENNVMDYSFLVGVTIPDTTKLRKPLIDEDSSQSTKRAPTSAFKCDYGGIYSEDKDEIYFFSVIDIFQAWNVRKKVENTFKSLIHEADAISAVRPDAYRERFLKFLNEIIQ